MRSFARGILVIGVAMLGYAGNSYLRAPGSEVDHRADHGTDHGASQVTGPGAGQMVDLKALVGGMGDQMQQVSRGARRPRAFLPRAPEGWSRRPFAWGDRNQLPKLAGLAAAVPGGAGKAAQRAFVRSKALSSWLYEADSGLVELAALRPKTGKAWAPRPETLADHPYAVIQGVVWWPVLPGNGAALAPQPDAWALVADLGDVRLSARGQGVTESGMRGLLGAIDYDGLNRTLENPSLLVGRAAPKLTPEQELAYARADMAQRETARREAAARAEAARRAAANREAEVRINRFGGKPACGGTAFCSVTGE